MLTIVWLRSSDQERARRALRAGVPAGGKRNLHRRQAVCERERMLRLV